MAKYEAVLFDLDGTLTESAPGIKKAIEMTMESFNLVPPKLDDVSEFVGPPLVNTFQKVCGLSADDAQEALLRYQKIYSDDGIYINELFPGMRNVLEKIKDSGIKMAICTSKSQKLAEKAAEIIGIKELFDVICGSPLDGSRKTKEQQIPFTIEKLGIKDKNTCIMVGDSMYDARGAVKSGVDFIAVTYGYGEKEQMKKEGAVNFADTPSEILKYLI